MDPARELGLPPSVEQKIFTKEDRTGRLLPIISGENEESVLVHQDASVYVSFVPSGQAVGHSFDNGGGAYLYLISGGARVNDERMATGDAAAIEDEAELDITAEEDTELLMVEVRME